MHQVSISRRKLYYLFIDLSQQQITSSSYKLIINLLAMLFMLCLFVSLFVVFYLLSYTYCLLLFFVCVYYLLFFFCLCIFFVPLFFSLCIYLFLFLVVYNAFLSFINLFYTLKVLKIVSGCFSKPVFL